MTQLSFMCVNHSSAPFIGFPSRSNPFRVNFIQSIWLNPFSRGIFCLWKSGGTTAVSRAVAGCAAELRSSALRTVDRAVSGCAGGGICCA